MAYRISRQIREQLGKHSQHGAKHVAANVDCCLDVADNGQVKLRATLLLHQTRCPVSPANLSASHLASAHSDLLHRMASSKYEHNGRNVRNNNKGQAGSNGIDILLPRGRDSTQLKRNADFDKHDSNEKKDLAPEKPLLQKSVAVETFA